jgi:hypothetical protein
MCTWRPCIFFQVQKVSHWNAISFVDIKEYCGALLKYIQTFKFNKIENNILLKSKASKDLYKDFTKIQENKDNKTQ